MSSLGILPLLSLIRSDTATMPLGQVRSKLGIIAQDPILLLGILRLNLDIEGIHTDDQLYDALRQVQLLRKIPEGSAASLLGSSLAGQASNEPTPGSSISSGIFVVKAENGVSIFSNLDFEVKSGGEK